MSKAVHDFLTNEWQIVAELVWTMLPSVQDLAFQTQIVGLFEADRISIWSKVPAEAALPIFLGGLRPTCQTFAEGCKRTRDPKGSSGGPFDHLWDLRISFLVDQFPFDEIKGDVEKNLLFYHWLLITLFKIKRKFAIIKRRFWLIFLEIA